MDMSKMNAAYWADKSHKRANRQPVILMSAAHSLPVRDDDPIVVKAVQDAVAGAMEGKSNQDYASKMAGMMKNNWLVGPDSFTDDFIR